jgi:CIC family chloride channel protein
MAQLPTRPRREVDLLEGIPVAEAMETTIDAVPPTMPLPQLLHRFEKTHHHGFPVTDEQGNLLGIVTLSDVEQAMLTPDFEQKTVADIATSDGIAVGYPDEPISEALWRMGVRGIGRLPIVDRTNPRRLLGVLRRQNVIAAYERAIANRKDISARLRELREAHEGNVRVVEVDIGDKHRFVGKQIKDIARELPDDCILVSIRRDRRVIIPHGTTEIRKGDHLVTLASAECAERVRAALR